MLFIRTVFSIAFIVLGALVIARIVSFFPQAGFRIVPGLVLGLAMIALGGYRIAQVARTRNMR
jgi:hypothetical protein